MADDVTTREVFPPKWRVKPFNGESDDFVRDGDNSVWVIVPSTNELFKRCMLRMPLYFFNGGGGRCVVFESPSKYEDSSFLHAYPIEFDKDDIIFHEKVGDDSEQDLIKDLTRMFYSTSTVLDFEGVDNG